MAATIDMTLQNASAISAPSDADDASQRETRIYGTLEDSDDTSKPTGKEISDRERVAKSNELVAAHHADVYRFACWLSGCPNAAEDICQETFLRAYRGIHNLRDEQAARSWLLTIARNEFARWCKRNRERSLPQSTDGHEHAQVEAPDSSNAFVDAEWVRKGLDELPENYRLVVVMYYFEEKTYAEISQSLNIPIGTVMSRLSRGKQHLKQHLQD